MKKRLAIAGVTVLVFLAALAGFHFVLKPAMIQEFVAQNAPPPASVSAEPAKTETWTPRRHAIGTLVAIQGVDISSQVSGIVKTIRFSSGDRVAAKAELVQLDDEVEQADLLSNRATLRDAIREFERQSDLQGRGFAAEARLDEARASRDSSAAAVQRTRALIDQKNIKAPFAGRLGLKQIDIGQYVSPGQALVSIQQLDPVWVDFPIPEKQIGLLAVGQTVEADVDAYPGETFTGVIETLDARVNQDTRTLTVRGRLENPDEKLLPGMFANVTVMAGEEREVVVVPRTAVSYSLYGDSVYVVKEDTEDSGAAGEAKAEDARKDEAAGQGEGEKPAGDADGDQKPLVVERRFVRLGETREDSVAISEGVKAGEMVVTSGQLKLKPDASVEINNESPLTPPETMPRQ